VIFQIQTIQELQTQTCITENNTNLALLSLCTW